MADKGPLSIQPLQDLLAKDMDRKEFLVHVGGIIMAVVGITGLIKKLSDPFGKSKKTGQSSGYGFSTYGGVSDARTANQAVPKA